MARKRARKECSQRNQAGVPLHGHTYSPAIAARKIWSTGGSHVYPLNWGTVKFDENDQIGDIVKEFGVCFRVAKRFSGKNELLEVCESDST